MVISASRRTDLPNYYFDWFLNRLEEGFVMVRNPFNHRQVSRIMLNKEAIDGIVFWSKNPEALLARLSEVEDCPFYLQYTLNPYGSVLEPGLPSVEERIQTFLALAQRLGKRRMVWRYDPIVLSPAFPEEYHLEQFERLASSLAGAADECIVSFMDEYKSTRRNETELAFHKPSVEEMKQIAAALAKIASRYGLDIRACAEETDLSDCGILPAHCIDAGRIREISGRIISERKDASQRMACGCIKSVDVGIYNTCPNGCLYCYANYSPATIQKNCTLHELKSPFMVGNLEEGDRVTVRK